MGKIYFLLIVGVCVVLLLMLILKLERKRKAQLKANRKKRQKKARQTVVQQAYRGTPGQHTTIHGRNTRLPSNVFGAWDARNRRAGTELGDEASFSANRLYFDNEKTEDESAARTVEYTPVGLPKTSDNRRR